jgi:serine/threonine-protein kinase RsbW
MHRYGKSKPFPGAAGDLDLRENVQRARVHLPSELGEIFARLENWMRILGYARRDLIAVQLALYEAATNAFHHGNRSDPSKDVRISFLVTPDEVLVSVQDQGWGFDPDLVPDPLDEQILDRPGGLGLLLLRACTTWLSFDPPGNRVTFGRRRSDFRVPALPGSSGPAEEQGLRDQEHP